MIPLFFKIVLEITSILFTAGFDINPDDISSSNELQLLYHRIVEAFKFAFAKRTYLGDPEFSNIAQVCLVVSCRMNTFFLF